MSGKTGTAAGFTPGPWRVCETSDGFHFVGSPATTLQACHPSSFEDTVAQVWQPEDAHLIAAAPEMYEALKAMYYALVSEPIKDAEDGEDCWFLKPSTAGDVMRNALRALAKAEGKSAAVSEAKESL